MTRPVVREKAEQYAEDSRKENDKLEAPRGRGGAARSGLVIVRSMRAEVLLRQRGFGTLMGFRADPSTGLDTAVFTY